MNTSRPIHASCAERNRQHFQNAIKGNMQIIQEYLQRREEIWVKCGFTVNPFDDDNDRSETIEREWIFVKIESLNIDDQTVTGWIDNEPVQAVHLHWEQQVTVRLADCNGFMTNEILASMSSRPSN